VRLLLVRLHRHAGLALAGVLCVAGVTRSLIAFQEEADRWLSADLWWRKRGVRRS